MVSDKVTTSVGKAAATVPIPFSGHGGADPFRTVWVNTKAVSSAEK